MAKAMIAGEFSSNSFWACMVFLLGLPFGRPRPNLLPGSNGRPRVIAKLLERAHARSPQDSARLQVNLGWTGFRAARVSGPDRGWLPGHSRRFRSVRA